MILKLSGRIIDILNQVSGTNTQGKVWSKQDCVIETDEQYSKKVCVTFFNDKSGVLQRGLIGSNVEVFFSIESREYQGKWFTNVNGFKIDILGAKQEQIAPTTTQPESNNNDLPF